METWAIEYELRINKAESLDQMDGQTWKKNDRKHQMTAVRKRLSLETLWLTLKTMPAVIHRGLPLHRAICRVRS